MIFTMGRVMIIEGGGVSTKDNYGWGGQESCEF